MMHAAGTTKSIVGTVPATAESSVACRVLLERIEAAIVGAEAAIDAADWPAAAGENRALEAALREFGTLLAAQGPAVAVWLDAAAVLDRLRSAQSGHRSLTASLAAAQASAREQLRVHLARAHASASFRAAAAQERA